MPRRVIVGLAAFLLLILVLSHRGELGTLARAAMGAHAEWLGAALLFQGVSLACLAALFRRVLETVAVSLPFVAAWQTLLATYAANLLAPSAGAAGLAVWIDALGRKAPPPRVAAAVLAASLLDLGALALLVIAALALAPAARHHAITTLAALTLATLLALGVLALVSAARRPASWARALAAAQALAFRLSGGRLRSDPEWAERTAALAGEAARTLAGRPSRLLTSGTFALAEHFASAAALGAVALAFGQRLAPIEVVGAYALAMLAWIASPVPQGIGVVELALAGSLAAAGASYGTAASIAVVHRGLTFWLPLAIGFPLLWRLQARK